MPKRRKTRTRADGEGSIIKETKTRANGSTYERWRGVLSIGYDAEGKRKRKTIYGKTQAEVREKLEEVKRQLAMGTYVDSELTVEQLLERWHTEKAQSVKPRTIEIYRKQAELHILPKIGRLKLAKLSPMHLQNLCSDIANNVGKRTAELIRVQLHGAFKQAVRWQILPKNPAEAITPLKVEKKPVTIWTPSEAMRFLDTARTHRLYTLFYLAMDTGLRRGELLALEWSHVTDNRLRVVTSKTRKGERTIKLAKDVTSVLEDHKTKQDIEIVNCSTWQDNGLVFPSSVGTPMNPRNLGREWYNLQKITRDKWREELIATGNDTDLKRLDSGELFPKIRLHDLRHLHASMLIQIGKSSVEVAERLGHTNPSFTVDTYGHIFREHQEEEEVSILDYLPPINAVN